MNNVNKHTMGENNNVRFCYFLNLLILISPLIQQFTHNDFSSNHLASMRLGFLIVTKGIDVYPYITCLIFFPVNKCHRLSVLKTRIYICNFHLFRYVLNTSWFHFLLLLAGDIESNPGPDVSCHKCNLDVVDSDKDALGCDACEKWYHKGCTGLIESEYKIFKKSSVTWICTVCKPLIKTKVWISSIESKLGEINININNIDKKLDGYDLRFSELETKFLSIEQGYAGMESEKNVQDKRISSLEEKYEKLATTFINPTNNLIDLASSSTIGDVIKLQVKSELLLAKKDIDIEEQTKLREKNIVLFNVSDFEDYKICEEHDCKILDKLLSCLNLDKFRSSIKFKRITSFHKERNRPLIVSFDSVVDKWKCYAGHTLLKQSEDDELSKISMSPDRSFEQRMVAKTLRKELLRRRGLNEDVVIYRNEIVDRASLKFKKLDTSTTT